MHYAIYEHNNDKTLLNSIYLGKSYNNTNSKSFRFGTKIWFQLLQVLDGSTEKAYSIQKLKNFIVKIC